MSCHVMSCHVEAALRMPRWSEKARQDASIHYGIIAPWQWFGGLVFAVPSAAFLAYGSSCIILAIYTSSPDRISDDACSHVGLLISPACLGGQKLGLPLPVLGSEAGLAVLVFNILLWDRPCRHQPPFADQSPLASAILC